MSETKTEEKVVDPREECLKEINAVLGKYQFSLVPTFQLVPVQVNKDTTVEEVEKATENDGTDESDPESSNT